MAILPWRDFSIAAMSGLPNICAFCMSWGLVAPWASCAASLIVITVMATVQVASEISPM